MELGAIWEAGITVPGIVCETVTGGVVEVSGITVRVQRAVSPAEVVAVVVADFACALSIGVWSLRGIGIGNCVAILGADLSEWDCSGGTVTLTAAGQDIIGELVRRAVKHTGSI